MTGIPFLIAVLVILAYSVAMLLATLDSAPDDEEGPSWPAQRPERGE